MLKFRKNILFSGVSLLIIFFILLLSCGSLIDKIVQKSFEKVSQESDFVSSSYEAHGQKHFTSMESQTLIKSIKTGVLIFSFSALVLYCVIAWSIIHYLTRPIQQIISAILPFQRRDHRDISKIILDDSTQEDEFTEIASALNTLTEHIQKQREAFKHQQNETQGILDSLEEGIVALDPSARVTYVNKTACKILNISQDELVGQTFLETRSRKIPFFQKCHELVLHSLQTSESTAEPWV